jgi:hypothetical protein
MMKCWQGHWKFPIKNSDKVGDTSFTDGQANKVEEKMDDIIKKALVLDESRATDWTEVFKRMEWILTTLIQREDNTDIKITIVGL